MDIFDGMFINVPCPKCSYGFDVEYLSARLQATVFCPCCKSSIQLVDGDASVHGVQEGVDSALQELQRELKMLGGTIRIDL